MGPQPIVTIKGRGSFVRHQGCFKVTSTDMLRVLFCVTWPQQNVFLKEIPTQHGLYISLT